MATIRRKGRHGDGTIYHREGSPYWWVKFHVVGTPVYESTKTKDKSEAKRYLRRRLGEVATGQFVSLKTGQLTIADLCQLVIEDYVDNQYRSLPDLRRKIEQHIEPIVGKERAIQFGTRHVKRYISRRQREEASAATINRELNVIRRGYTLAHRSDPPLVMRMPYIATLAENNIRRDFMEYDQYLALRAELPFHWALFLVIAYNTGVRLSEVLGDNRKERLKEPLLWDRIDRVAKRIYFPDTKNGESRIVPFIGDMEEWIEMAWEDHVQNWPECRYVIQKHGKPVYDPRKAWNKACLIVGIPNLWRHDMRRSAVRNLDRSGVESKIATAISGHKTRSVYDRYNIVADRDLSDAAQKMDVYLQTKREQAEKAPSKPTQ
jgi:integrase